jgi:aconitate hydratase
MGVLPLEFLPGESVASLGLTGREQYDVVGLAELLDGRPLPDDITVRADGNEFRVRVRIDTPFERSVFLDGGILPFTLRALASA